MIQAVADALLTEARAENERRLLVLTGTHTATVTTAVETIRHLDIPQSDTVLIADTPHGDLPHHSPTTTASLLGTTITALIVDVHHRLEPTTLARVIGTVTGGGLIILCCPPLDTWPTHRDHFDETLTIPPATIDAVTNHFRTRFITTLQTHPGIAIIDLDTDTVERDGLTNPAAQCPIHQTQSLSPPSSHRFPESAYSACLTDDQQAALTALETLTDPNTAVVLESDRGRGKSSVLGLGAACYANQGNHVTVTAPTYENAREVFARASDLLDTPEPTTQSTEPRSIDTASGGRIDYRDPSQVLETDPDILLVDEAAAIPVPRLRTYLTHPRIAFATTIHGYEGTGRGFSVRFADHLAASNHTTTHHTLTTPIRYAPGDPIETWAFRAFLLNARPAPDQLVDTATPDTTTYHQFTPTDLLATDQVLTETFGLLVLAHYQTEPNDLARLLDAPNIHTRALTHNDHIVTVALLADEGNLPPETQRRMYEGTRIKGNMLPDLLTSQLRDETAGATSGIRILRIATHPAVRSRGLGSQLLTHIHTEFNETHDWLGTSYGATPDLIRFWDQNGYSTIHVSTTRNDTSGEHSIAMLTPLTPDGQTLHDQHARWFAKRIQYVLTDALRHLDPDIIRHALRATNTTISLDLTDREWRHIDSMAYGPGLLDIDPGPFRHFATKHLIDPTNPSLLTPRQERLIISRVLQATPWTDAQHHLPPTDTQNLHSPRQYNKTIGTAYQLLVDEYGTPAAHTERNRYQ